MSQHSSNVNIEINALWHAGKYELAYIQISRSLVPILVNWVGSQGVHQDDCSDIVGDALQAFWKKVHDDGPLGIERPAAYLWRAAFTKKCDYWHKSKKLPVTESSLTAGLPSEERISPHQYLDEQFHSGKGRQFVPDFQRKAIYLVEGLFDDAEVSESDAPFLVEETLKLMRAG